MTTRITPMPPRPTAPTGFWGGPASLVLVAGRLRGAPANDPIILAAMAELRQHQANTIGIVGALHRRGVRDVTGAAIEAERQRIIDSGEPMPEPGIPLPWAGVRPSAGAPPAATPGPRSTAQDRELKRKIQGHLDFLAKVRRDQADRQRPGHGLGEPSLTAALTLNDGDHREAEDREKWIVAAHEAGHACVMEVLMPGNVKFARVDAGGRSGLCQYRSEGRQDLMAISTSAGAEAEVIVGGATSSRMQDHGPHADGPQFLAAVSAYHGKDVAEYGDETAQAWQLAQRCVQDNYLAIRGLAKLLYDDGEVSGETVATVVAYHRGDYDEQMEAAFWKARLAGDKGWPWARGIPKNF
ncbi:MAG: hypothetical protein K8S99_12210 [Planctomycetes bacterium]|nr:hypothetical protein [Planctomycetota bacterium]